MQMALPSMNIAWSSICVYAQDARGTQNIRWGMMGSGIAPEPFSVSFYFCSTFFEYTLATIQPTSIPITKQIA
jgi:hypothetical protein